MLNINPCHASLFYAFSIFIRDFKANTSFDQVLNVNIFDRQPRLLVMDAVERVEVAVRTTISNSMSEQYGAHWYLNGNLFVKKYNHQQLLQIVRQATGFNNPNIQTVWLALYGYGFLAPLFHLSS